MVPAFEPRLRIERHTEVAEIGHARGRLSDQRPDGALAAQAATCAHRVLRVQFGAIVIPSRRSHSALREVASG